MMGIVPATSCNPLVRADLQVPGPLPSGGCSSCLLGVKKTVWYLLGCSASKGPQQVLLRYLLGY